ncbi:MAG: lysozyme inhibitor LprI family protein [Rhodoblastus sp.]
MVEILGPRARARVAGRLPALLLLSASPALAQSFDCSKAAPPIETAICASTALRAQDNALAGAYARAQYVLRDDAAALDLLKQAQRQWISARNRDCARAGDKVADCLVSSYSARLTEIGKALGAQQVAAPRQPPLVQPAQQQAPQPVQATQARPAPAAQPQQQPAPAQQPAQPARPTSVTAPGARVEPQSVPADRDASALVTIPNPGRYSLRAESASGVAIQLVDMMAGPGDSSGAAGAKDGRLDVLLDKGVYKLRTSGAKGAAKPAMLKAEAFRDAAPPALLATDPLTPGDLGDLQQRSFWIDVDNSGRVAIEALGRALQDFRLWRDGEELADLQPDIATVEVKAGHPMNRIRLEGRIEPGRYLATAYGGESAVWADGAPDKPFMIRRLANQSVAAGLAEAAIGAFGSARFEAPADFDTFRLEIADPAPVRMVVKRGGERRNVSLARNSRDPFVVATLPAKDRAPAIVEISGLEGQAVRLRALRDTRDLRISGGGPTQVIVDVAGEGGDEIPATAILVRFEQNKARLVASDAPRIAPGQAWRRRFNLRGPSTILFETTGPGPLAIRMQGPAARAVIEPVFGFAQPRADGRTPGRYDLDAGVYMLRLTPAAGASGVFDLTLGQPGLVPEISAGAAPRTALSLGLHNIERGASYAAIANSAPGLLIGMRAVASPVDLSRGPVGLYQGLPAPRAAGARRAPAAPQIKPATQQRGERRPPTESAVVRTPAQQSAPQGAPSSGQQTAQTTQSAVRQPGPRSQQAQIAPPPAAQPAAPPLSADIALQARAPLGGAIRVRDQRGADVSFAISDEKTEKDSRVFTLRIPAAVAPRALEIAWAPPPPPAQPVRPRQPLQTVAAGEPLHFDLAEGQRREFRIEAREGGLYRVETLGRLKTGLTIGTNFLPRLGSAENNGAGHNGLVQTYLRAGSYRVAVAAKEFERASRSRRDAGRNDDDRRARRRRFGARDAVGRARRDHADRHSRSRKLPARSLCARAHARRAPRGRRRLAAHGARSAEKPRHQARARQIPPRHAAGRRRRAHGRAPDGDHARRGARRPRAAQARLRRRAQAAMARARIQGCAARARRLDLRAQGRGEDRPDDCRRHDRRDHSRRKGKRRQGYEGSALRRQARRRRLSHGSARHRPRRPARLHGGSEIRRIAARRFALRRPAGDARSRHRAGQRRQSRLLRPQGPQGRAARRQRRHRRAARRPPERLEHRHVAPPAGGPLRADAERHEGRFER